MKKAYYFIMLFNLFLLFKANAQVNYTFNTLQTTYTPIVNGINPPLNTPTPVGYYENDEGFANAVPIGFSFKFNNIDYTKLNINVNGFVSFGKGFTKDVLDKYSTNNLSNGLVQDSARPIIAPLWDDLKLGNNNSLQYKLTGVAPNRVFTIEWADVHWDFNAIRTSISFQMKLMEGSNKIQFIYQPSNNLPLNASASVGLAMAGTQFLSVNTLSSTARVSTIKEFNTVDKLPNAGLTFEFAPGKVIQPHSLSVDGYNTQNVSFSWSGITSSSYDYALNTSVLQPDSFSTTVLNNVSVENLNFATKYFIHLRSTANNQTSGWLTIPVATATQVSLPFQENFEAITASTLPNTMVAVNPRGGNAWKTEALSNLPPYNKVISVAGSQNADNDAWLILPGMKLEGGSSYRIKFKFRASDTMNGSQRLEIRIGRNITPNMSGWQNIYRNYNIKQLSFKDTSFIFAPPNDEVYFVAFRSVSIKNDGALWLDEIEAEKVKPLPVKLISFTGIKNKNINQIYWKTAAEVRNKLFEIQRSSDGKNFSTLDNIATRAPNGTSAVALDYYYEHKEPNTVDYYRLKFSDIDNNEFYSQTIKVIGELAPKLVYNKIFPNPTTNTTTSIIYSPYTAKAIFTIVDCFGKTVFTTEINVNTGDNIIKTDVSKLAKGIYYAKLQALIGGESETKAFIKQ